MDNAADEEKTREQLIQEIRALRYFVESARSEENEQMRLEQAFGECRTTLDGLVVSSPEPVLVIDTSGVIILSNEPAAAKFDRDAKDMVGACLHELLPAKTGEESRRRVEEVLFTGRLTRFSEVHKDHHYDTCYAPIFDKQGTVSRVAVFSTDQTQREDAVAAFKALEHRYRITSETVGEGIYQATPDGRLTNANSALARILGYSSPEVFLESVADIALDLIADPGSRAEFARLIGQNSYVQNFETQMLHKNGSLVWVSVTARAVRDKRKKLLYYEGAVEDVTKRKRLEAQLRQSQKTEAVGRLASGIAHDFNNLVTVMLGNLDLLLSCFTPDDEGYQEIKDLQRTVGNASKLCTQFLDLSQKQFANVSEIDLNDVILRMGTMFRRLLGEDIRQDLALDPSVGIIRADPSLVEQIILNLAVNARDAMPGGGTLRISTEMEHYDDGANREMMPGDYVVLTMADTGTGILPAILEHIFEPFNTIKPDGSGLGLSIVHSIVKQFGGHISVESERGRGTAFHIYLPIAAQQAKAGAAGETPPVDLIPPGKATVLVVEDDPSVLNLIVDFLESLEYTVHAATSVDEAISVIETPGRHIDLLISDVVLPGKHGTELALLLKEKHPEMKIMLMSGYADDRIPHGEILRGNVHFLSKPFTPLMLVMKVQEVLEDARAIL